MADTAIEWTDKTWNPVVGCSKVSPGCKNCYAKTLHDQRHKAFHAGKKVPLQYAKPFEEVQLMPDRLDTPLTWRDPKKIFVNSVSDLFHADVPDEFLLKVFDTMRTCTWAGGQNCGKIRGNGHTFQVLTKRADRMMEFGSRLRWDGERLFLGATGGSHFLSVNRDVWMGVSVEDQQRADERIPSLLGIPGGVKFLSCEPLLGPLKLDLLRNETGNPAQCVCGHGHGFTRCPNTGGISAECHVNGCGCKSFVRRYGSWRGIDWVILGGESGPGARPCRVQWVRDVVAQCKAAGVPVFVKQLGANPQGDDFPDDGKVDPATGMRTFTLRQIIRIHDKKGGDMSEWPDDLKVREFPEARAA